MPYTPPGPQSPATSKPTTPAASRSSSYSELDSPSHSISRPAPPRSSSSSYLHRHRRSPSITKPETLPPKQPESNNTQPTNFANSGSVRQSPPPVNNLTMPTGAVLSPPESPETSDGETSTKDRGRELESNWIELQEAVRAIDQNKGGSPEREPKLPQVASEPVSQCISPTALTPEPKKISHRRSTTETIQIPRSPHFDSSLTQSSDDSDEDGNEKPPLVRKKSGELVKPALRPSSRRRYSSMPGTPTYSKSVHFNDNDNQTRHFLQVDKPIAVSAGSSPVETYDSESEFPFEEGKPQRQIRLTNFPSDTFERRTKPVRVERIFLSQDKEILIGVVAVQNISFHKLVVARFTLDYWKTTSETVAEFNNDPRNPPVDGCDRFNFHIKLSDQANIDDKTLLLCVRYNVGGQEFWDNNNDTNFQIDFSKTVQKPVKPSVTLNVLGRRPVNAIPRSRHTQPSNSRGRPHTLEDDFATRSDSESFSFGLGESPTSVKLKPRTGRGSLFDHTSGSQSPNGLGGRYDFGASLSAALSTAQDKLGRQGSPMAASPAKISGDNYFAPLDRKDGPTKTNERPDALTTDRPAMGSDQYKDLVQKFCYFTSGPTGKPATPSVLPPSGNAVATNHPTNDDVGASTETPPASESTSASSSGNGSPCFDGSNDATAAATSRTTPFTATSRSASSTPITGGGMGGRSASPISFGYPYTYNDGRGSYLSDSYGPTAILG